MQRGIVYTETVVYSPPEKFAADAPYQLALVDLEDFTRLTVRILLNSVEDRVKIGDAVMFVDERGGVKYFRKSMG